MTMQVAMVGTDGIILASDTRWMETGAVRQTGDSSKIILSHERGMAIACARNLDTARLVARDIVSLLKDDEFNDPEIPIERIAAKHITQTSDRRDVQCLVVLAKPKIRLFFLETGISGGEVRPVCVSETTKRVAGDNLNAAIFVTERYYTKRSIHELIPLSAHLIVAASKLNPGGIGGLEIVLCDASGLHRLSNASISELEIKTEEWDASIGELFRGYSQQFTYAPNVSG